MRAVRTFAATLAALAVRSTSVLARAAAATRLWLGRMGAAPLLGEALHNGSTGVASTRTLTVGGTRLLPFRMKVLLNVAGVGIRGLARAMYATTTRRLALGRALAVHLAWTMLAMRLAPARRSRLTASRLSIRSFDNGHVVFYTPEKKLDPSFLTVIIFRTRNWFAKNRPRERSAILIVRNIRASTSCVNANSHNMS